MSCLAKNMIRIQSPFLNIIRHLKLRLYTRYKINALPSYFQDFCLDRGSDEHIIITLDTESKS